MNQTTFLSDTFSFFQSHYKQIAMIVLPITLPVEIFRSIYMQLIHNPDQDILPMLPVYALDVITYPIITIGVILYIASCTAGEDISHRSAWKLGIRHWWPFMIVQGMVLIISMVGLLLLIIPGFIAAFRLLFANYHLLLEGDKASDAISNSWQSTKPWFWTLAGGLLLLFLILFLPLGIILGLLGSTGALATILTPLINSAFAVAASILSIFTYRVYCHAKAQHQATVAVES